MTKILKTKALVDPSLSEFVYSVAITTPVHMKRRLPLKYYNAILTERSAKTFSVKSTLSQKKEFLEYLGFRSFFIVSNVDNVWNSEFKDILKKYENGTKKMSLKEIADDGLFVTSDKELVHLFTKTSNAVNSELYRMQQELFRVNHAQMKWSTKLDSEEIEEVKKEMKSSKDLMKFAMHTIIEFINCNKFLDVDSNELSILLRLYMDKDSYISHKEIIETFGRLLPVNTSKAAERRLLSQLMIQPHVDYREKSFTITSRGIRTVHQFRDRVLKSFNF